MLLKSLQQRSRTKGTYQNNKRIVFKSKNERKSEKIAIFVNTNIKILGLHQNDVLGL